MNLTIKERIELFRMLPSEGSFGTLRTVRTLREKLEFTDEERVQVGLKLESHSNPFTGEDLVTTRWDPQFAATEFTLEFTEGQLAFLSQHFRKLDVSGKIPEILFRVAEQLLPAS